MRSPLLLPVLVAAVLAGCGGEDLPKIPEVPEFAGGCKAFESQRAAQQAWEAAGRPRALDPDGDGVVCESLPPRAR